MKSLIRSLLIIFLGSGVLVFASGGLDCPTCGQPPRGIGIDGSAQGTKLDGVISIEFYSIGSPDSNGRVSASGRFLLRLRKGNDFAMFYAEAPVSDMTDPGVVQSVITQVMEPQVLVRFFQSTSLDVRLKVLDAFVQLPTTTSLTGHSVFILSDITLAVQ